jgi:ribosome maturation factor RimP
MIKREEEKKKSIKVSGTIISTSDTTITVEEKKKDETKVDVFDLAKEFTPFVDTEVAFSISKSIKGTVTSIDDNGVNIFDSKNEKYITIDIDTFKAFIGDNIKFSISESRKDEVESFDEE